MKRSIAAAKDEGRNLLEPEALELFAEYGLPIPAFRLVDDAAGAVKAAGEIGYPVVLKIVSKDILHKSDAGGVRVNLGDAASVKAAYLSIMESVKAYKPDADVTGVMVRAMLEEGLECIIGMTRDPSFGPAFMFGLGGIFADILSDVSFRVLPLKKEDAVAMIKELKAAPILLGARGQEPKDIDAIADALLKVAKMTEENPEIRELDINPVFVYNRGVMTADARVMM